MGCVERADALSGRQNWDCEDLILTHRKGTCSVKKLRRRERSAKRGARRVRVGSPDWTLTGMAGLAAVDELIGRLGIVASLDPPVVAIAAARGLSARE